MSPCETLGLQQDSPSFTCLFVCETWWTLREAWSFTRGHCQSSTYASVKLVKAVFKPFLKFLPHFCDLFCLLNDFYYYFCKVTKISYYEGENDFSYNNSRISTWFEHLVLYRWYILHWSIRTIYLHSTSLQLFSN